ncbi:MAG: hypothetical protein ABSB86_19970, partial [Bryobacteraceae bacterium]
MESEARLTIARTSPEDLKQRQVIIKLDGEWIADLMYDHTMTRAIQPGHHHLRVDNTWNKKNLEFDAAAGEEVRFRVVNRAGRFTWFLVASLGAG